MITPELICYPLEHNPPKIVPARPSRDWMDETPERFAYRCIPLSIANASGWELLCPEGFRASWMGHADKSAIRLEGLKGRPVPHFVTSHFGAGVLTFHAGWLFKTSPGWAVWARGTPNHAKPNLHALDGLVETDWLPMPFTMNWRFTRATTIEFAEGEPFCFLSLFAHEAIEDVQPVRRKLEDDPELKAAYEAWSQDRAGFLTKLKARDPGTVEAKWQKHYVRGEGPAGAEAGFHLSKRRLKDLKDG